jgi:hypothetical protein
MRWLLLTHIEDSDVPCESITQGHSFTPESLTVEILYVLQVYPFSTNYDKQGYFGTFVSGAGGGGPTNVITRYSNKETSECIAIKANNLLNLLHGAEPLLRS